MDLSKEATLLMPVLSAQATRYASAKLRRYISYTFTARNNNAFPALTTESNARSDCIASATFSRGAS